MTLEKEEESKLPSKAKVLVILFCMAALTSVGFSFYRFFLLRDYPIQAETSCDPAIESCFVYHCDEEVGECSGNPAEDTSYYKLVERNAQNIPLCNPAEESCDALVCGENESGCVVTVCDPASGEECSNPQEYLLQQSQETAAMPGDAAEIQDTDSEE